MKGLTKKQKLFLFALTLLLLLSMVGLYFLKVHPALTNQAKIEKSLQTEQKLLDVIEKQLNDMEGVDFTDESIALQRKLPLQPFMEQVFLLFNEAQNSTDSLVTQYTISEPDIPVAEVQEGMMEVVFDLSVTSPSYESMLNFIDYLEKNERIVSVNAMSFSGDRDGALDYEVNMSVFFTDGFNKLRTNQPTIDIPEPSNKTNPLR